jgi:hypothetical protein
MEGRAKYNFSIPGDTVRRYNLWIDDKKVSTGALHKWNDRVRTVTFVCSTLWQYKAQSLPLTSQLWFKLEVSQASMRCLGRTLRVGVLA